MTYWDRNVEFWLDDDEGEIHVEATIAPDGVVENLLARRVPPHGDRYRCSECKSESWFGGPCLCGRGSRRLVAEWKCPADLGLDEEDLESRAHEAARDADNERAFQRAHEERA